MFISDNTVKISDLRKHTHKVLDEMKLEPEAVTVFSRSEPVAVIMSIQSYKELTHANKKISAGMGPGAQFFSKAPKNFMLNGKGKSAVELIRELRD